MPLKIHSGYIYSCSELVHATKKNTPHTMPEKRHSGSISRTLLLPQENHGTFRLRHILAEDGCKESQVSLAKTLLYSPVSTAEERNFNAQLAVYWLLQAAKKGQEEACELLKKCASAGIGVNAANGLEVEKCLKFSYEDKVSRRVAFAVFHAIMSDTEELIPEDVFREKVEHVIQSENCEKSTKTCKDDPVSCAEPIMKTTGDTSLRNQAHVSFSEVVNSVQSCLEGNVPLVSLKQVAQYSELKKWLPTKYVYLLWDILFKSLGDLLQNLSSLVLLVSVFFLGALFEIYSAFSSANEISAVNNAKIFFATLLCLLTMLSSTCFVISVSFGSDNMKKWLHLIKFFEPNIKSNEIEKKYLMKTSFPLLTFLVISLIYIIILPLNHTPKLFNDLGILSLILMLLVDRTVTDQRYFVNISLFLNALACLFKVNILQNMSISSLSFLNFDITYELGKNFQLHISFISCLALPFVLPYLYTKMALGSERKGWHLVLLPHLMSVTWMNLACIHLVDSSNDLILSLFTWLIVLVVSYYLGTFLTFVLYSFIKAVWISNLISLEFIPLILTFAILYASSLLIVKKLKISNDNKLWSLVICLIILLLSYRAAKPQALNLENDSSSVLSWDKYQTYCHHHAWYRTNPAEVQISCLPLKGRKVSVEGTITGIDVIEVHNSVQVIANILPNPFHKWFVCLLGKKYIHCDAEVMTQAEKEQCKLHETFNFSDCHLHNWNEYKYQIILEVSTRTSPEIILYADHACSSFIRSLKEGDSLHVIGTLESNIGSTLPKFHLKEAYCSSCYSDAECKTSFVVPVPNYDLSLKNVVGFYLSPFIQFEPKLNS